MKAARLLLATIAIVALTVPASATTPQIAAQFDYFASGGSIWVRPFSNNYIIAQTFVPTINGTVVSSDALVAKNYLGNPQGIPISFEIRTVWDSGLNGWQPDRRPGVQPISTGSVSADNPLLNDMFINWVNVPMTACELQSGQRYAIVASAIGTSQAYDWYTKGDASAYPDGRVLTGYNGDALLGQQDYDLPFRVNVVPEPASLLALGSGLIGLLGIRLRRK